MSLRVPTSPVEAVAEVLAALDGDLQAFKDQRMDAGQQGASVYIAYMENAGEMLSRLRLRGFDLRRTKSKEFENGT